MPDGTAVVAPPFDFAGMKDRFALGMRRLAGLLPSNRNAARLLRPNLAGRALPPTSTASKEATAGASTARPMILGTDRWSSVNRKTVQKNGVAMATGVETVSDRSDDDTGDSRPERDEVQHRHEYAEKQRVGDTEDGARRRWPSPR